MSEPEWLKNQPVAPVETAPVKIREAEPVDIPTVSDLDARITGIPKPDYWRRAFTRYGTRPQRYFLVAERADRVCGFIIGEDRAWEFGSPPCGWIFAIGVDPAHRLAGIGTRLFEAICARMRANGMTTVRTMLARDDALNMAFFRSQGMKGGSFIQLEMPLD
ncbi:MAG TPA: GNAT family N-acetyltransferase [Alphaproteobacteria bacterium]|jgi:ribosomal protein S18 acetylase RimI-like enzyme